MATKKKEPAAEVEEVTEAVVVPDTEDGAPAEAPLDAVIVVKRIDEQGLLHTEIVLNGSIQPTEVQTLLELGVKGWREQIGLA